MSSKIDSRLQVNAEGREYALGWRGNDGVLSLLFRPSEMRGEILGNINHLKTTCFASKFQFNSIAHGFIHQTFAQG